MLYVVPTPIGNLGDMTMRAIDVLKEVEYILAEDTRVTKKLLSHFDIGNKIVSFHAHNEHQKVSGIIKDLATGLDLAMVSDAGTPGISDPGFLLVKRCHEEQISVTTLPGSTALIPALVNSGLPMNRFHFEGFLPTKKGRQTRLRYLSALSDTFILYESPHRIVKCLAQLMEHCGSERKGSISRELTKIHEEVINGTLQELHAELSRRPSVKGEIVLVVAANNHI